MKYSKEYDEKRKEVDTIYILLKKDYEMDKYKIYIALYPDESREINAEIEFLIDSYTKGGIDTNVWNKINNISN